MMTEKVKTFSCVKHW